MSHLRKLARDRECMIRIPGVCNGDPSTVVLAHIRLAGVSGMGIKGPDILGSWACSSCHSHVDTHHDDQTKVFFYEGVFRTVNFLVKQGVITW